MFDRVLIDGVEVDASSASIPVTDVGFVRGFGVFEVIRAYDGVNLRLGDHLDRLGRSADMLGLALPPRDDLWAWCSTVASGVDGAVVRILVTGHDDPWDEQVRTIVTAEPPHIMPDTLTLHPVTAPWHSDGASWELLRGKTLSYANNFGAIRQAKLAGCDDALLLGRSGSMLEGPTFSVAWAVEEDGELIYETPALSLGILDSITREIALDAAAAAGLRVREVERPLGDLAKAAEFCALSTLRTAIPVTQIDRHEFDPAGPAVKALREAIDRQIGADLAAGR